MQGMDGDKLPMLVTPQEAKILEAVRAVAYGEVRVYTRNNLPQRIERVESELLDAKAQQADACK